MTELSNNYLGDAAIIKLFGAFIRHHRLEQNKTQTALAKEAGINRSTLSEFEKGRKISMDTFVRLLRVLNLLHVIEQFKVEPQISPLKLAEMQMSLRKRASRSKPAPPKPKPGW